MVFFCFHLLCWHFSAHVFSWFDNVFFFLSCFHLFWCRRVFGRNDFSIASAFGPECLGCWNSLTKIQKKIQNGGLLAAHVLRWKKPSCLIKTDVLLRKQPLISKNEKWSPNLCKLPQFQFKASLVFRNWRFISKIVCLHRLSLICRLRLENSARVQKWRVLSFFEVKSVYLCKPIQFPWN